MLVFILLQFLLSFSLGQSLESTDCLAQISELKQLLEVHAVQLAEAAKFREDTLKWQRGLISILPKSYSLSLFKFLSTPDNFMVDVSAPEPISEASFSGLADLAQRHHANSGFLFTYVL